MMRDEKIQSMIHNEKTTYQTLLDGLQGMNQVGRKYIVGDPGDKRKAIVVLQSVVSDIDCLFLHLVDRPAICMQKQLPRSSSTVDHDP